MTYYFLRSSHELWAGHHEVPAEVQVLVTGRLDQHGHRVIILPAGDQPEQNVKIIGIDILRFRSIDRMFNILFNSILCKFLSPV